MAKKSISGRQLRKMVTDFAEQQQNNTFNYHQVSAALGLKAVSYTHLTLPTIGG